MRLPLNEKLQTSLYEMSDKWENLLEAKNVHLYKLLYCLQIIESFIIDVEKEKLSPIDITETIDVVPFKNHEWAYKFYQSGGLSTLMDILLSEEFQSVKSNTSIRCLNIIQRIFCYFFVKIDLAEFFGSNQEQKTKFINFEINLLHQICQYSIQREEKETDADRES